VTFRQLIAIRREMANLKGQLLCSLARNPDDFDGREPLWMRHQDLGVRLTA
jgi:hypothetical protein